ncbi:ribosomal L1 domain-containing protein 1 [Chanos chanos]|uniref:Ribosomal L1 domain-containing protein 1 n=1 Tax=Chanos chanos TaxID=29144 RepID=A0A6J2VDN0_CHACN|nr:ribosomal L1 domain-containing protein 1 [Chanos chanos]
MDETPHVVELDQAQVKKAVQALQAYLKSTSSGRRLLDDNQHIFLLLTVWKIPQVKQTVRIPLPHGIRKESGEVCLFTRDEPQMTSDQTERFYKKLLTERGVKNVSEVIPYKVLKTEYKPFEAKRRLLKNFDLFLADARILRLLPSHIGKHFYETKKNPLSVDLESKHLARDMERLIQGTSMTISVKGPCSTVRVAHSGMTAEEIVENIITAVRTISSKMRSNGMNIKIIHLKSQTSVALPIYTSDLSHLSVLEQGQAKAALAKKNKRKKQNKPKTDASEEGDETVNEEGNKAESEEIKEEEEKDDEEIPQLVPIETPSKKAKLEVTSKKGLRKAQKPAGKKGGLKNKKGSLKLTKKDSKPTGLKPKKKVPTKQ